MTDLRCDRDYRHFPHDFTDGGTIRRCPGTSAAYALPELLAERPVLADVGLTPKVIQLGVMSA